MEPGSDEQYVVGVDLSASDVAAAVVDTRGQVLAVCERALERNRTAGDLLAGPLVDAIQDAVQQAGVLPAALRAVGVNLPGTIRPEEGRCLLCPPLGWEDVPVRDSLEQLLERPTTVINTVQALLLGERVFGSGRGIDNFFCCSLGNTILGGLVIRGSSYGGDSDSAGEIGHVTVDPDGLPCTCGNQGCLETMVSGAGIARMAQESLKMGAQSLLTDWVADEGVMTAELVHRAARQGDVLAIKIWEKVGRYLGLGLAAVVTVVNPARIILAGKVSLAFDFFAPTLREEIRRRARMVPRDFTQIVASPLGARSALMGSAAAAFESSGADRSLLGEAAPLHLPAVSALVEPQI